MMEMRSSPKLSTSGKAERCQETSRCSRGRIAIPRWFKGAKQSRPGKQGKEFGVEIMGCRSVLNRQNQRWTAPETQPTETIKGLEQNRGAGEETLSLSLTSHPPPLYLPGSKLGPRERAGGPRGRGPPTNSVSGPQRALAAGRGSEAEGSLPVALSRPFACASELPLLRVLLACPAALPALLLVALAVALAAPKAADPHSGRFPTISLRLPLDGSHRTTKKP